MKEPSTNWRFWLFWLLAFLAFPVAGLLAHLTGAVTPLLRTLMAGSEWLWPALMTGLSVGAAQSLALWQVLPLSQSLVWMGVVRLVWAPGWPVARSAGMNPSPNWSLFGASGALTFQIMTGLALYLLLRSAQPIR